MSLLPKALDTIRAKLPRLHASSYLLRSSPALRHGGRPSLVGRRLNQTHMTVNAAFSLFFTLSGGRHLRSMHTHHTANGGSNGTVGSQAAPVYASAAEADAINSQQQVLSAQEANWHTTMRNVVRAVVAIHFSSVSAFDTEGAYVSQATGFVVDAERGLILTNRHVVGPGLFRGYAVFDNHEECPVDPVYRDPVHDFGILRFDPKAVQHMTLHALQLRPEKAHVGCEIRVVGNDAGEKLSILAGFISRVDRNAPDYGELNYNDFNTEYIQAAAAASGGSSGSPVVDIHGHVLALQAGGSTSAATDFFLPLFRGLRALRCVQQNMPVTRGTIQVQWLLRPYDECIRLGLTPEQEDAARKAHPTSIGLLVAETVLPDGPGDGHILEGDCLLTINGSPLATFRDLDTVLDNSVDSKVTLEISRNGKARKLVVSVGDLHKITPSRYVGLAGGVFHDLSYQIARYYAIPCRGVYVAQTGVFFRFDGIYERAGWIIDEIANTPVDTLDDFIDVLRQIPDRSRVTTLCRHVSDPHTVVVATLLLDHKWVKPVLCTRDDATGLWNNARIEMNTEQLQIHRSKARFAPLNLNLRVGTDAASSLSHVNASFVKVKCMTPIAIEGQAATEFVQQGFVVDADLGLVLVSRLCVPHFGTEVSVIVGESAILPAEVVFLHPQQSYAILKYDPKLVDAPLQTLHLSHEPLKQGDRLVFVGYDLKSRPHITETQVTDITTTEIPMGLEVPLRYRATNLRSVTLDSFSLAEIGSGVLVDGTTGEVRALWMSFLADVNPATFRDRQIRLALDSHDIVREIETLRAGKLLDPRFVDCEGRSISYARARLRHVPDEYLQGVRPELVEVSRVSSSLASYLKEGDVLVALNDQPFNSAAALNNLSESHVKLTLVRRGHEKTIDVPTVRATDTCIKHIVSWCGMVIHRPHHAVLQQLKKPPSQVYVASCEPGSPANMYGIWQTSFVTHVNGESTPDVESFYRLVSQVPDNTYVKLRVESFEGVPQAKSIRTNYHYFPTEQKDLTIPEPIVRK